MLIVKGEIYKNMRRKVKVLVLIKSGHLFDFILVPISNGRCFNIIFNCLKILKVNPSFGTLVILNFQFLSINIFIA